MNDTYTGLPAALRDNPPLITPEITRATQIIIATRELLVKIAQEAEATILEQLWIINKGLGGDPAAMAWYARVHLQMDGEKVVEQVGLWSAVRKNRELRELGRRQPLHAMSVVESLSHAGIEHIADDPLIAEVLTKPPAGRAKLIKQLIESQRTDTAPEPVQAPAPVATIVQGAPALTALTEQILDAERQLAGYPRERLAQVSETDKERLLRALDSAVAAIDNIIDVVTQQ